MGGTIIERIWIDGSSGSNPLIRVGVDFDNESAMAGVVRDVWIWWKRSMRRNFGRG